MKPNTGDLKTKVRGSLIAIIQKDKLNVNVLPNMHSPPLEGNFWGKHGWDVKLATVQEYIRHMGYAEVADWLGSGQRSYSSTFWTLPLSIVNSCNILPSYGSKLSHWLFRLTLVRDLPQEPGKVPRPQTTRQRRQAPTTSQLRRLNSRHNGQWLMQCKRIWCCECSTKMQSNKNTTRVKNAT
jgi:hypothetical protein